GGTLALSLTAGGVTQTTAALAWNATADDVAAQINQGVTGVRASVTGTGLPDDPWLIIAGDQSLTTGMAVTYQDSWNLPNLGLTNGQVCYVVVQSEQVVPQTLILGLATTYAEAMQATPVLINQQPWYALVAAGQGIMTGAPATLAELAAEGEASGISVVATLESSDSAKSSANLGLFPLMGYVVHPRGNWLGAQGANQGIEQELAHKIPAGMNLPNSFELTAAPAVAEVTNVVQALVLGTASLETAGVVTIASELTEIVHSTSTASIAKPTLGANDKAVAIAFNLALVNNTAQAVIAPGGWVTGGSGVSVTSDIEYPFVLRETNLSGYRRGTLTPSTVNRTQTAENILGNAIFSSMGGISKWLFN
ncbi:MAG: hypothetical protein ACKOFW_01410, partial [Planctomycetaceae bacterium]